MIDVAPNLEGLIVMQISLILIYGSWTVRMVW